MWGDDLRMKTAGILLVALMVGWGACALRAQTPSDGSGAYATGKYRNLFKDGHSEKEIHAKIEAAYRAALPRRSANADGGVCRGSNSNGPLMYLTDWNNKDVRTEGMSYGMTITVELDKKWSSMRCGTGR